MRPLPVPSARAAAPAALALALLLAACGRDEPAAEPAASPPVAAAPADAAAPERDPCALLTAEEVRAAARVAAEAGEPAAQGSARGCTWSDPGGKEVVAELHDGADGFAAARRGYEARYEARPDPLAGVGDEALIFSGAAAGVPAATVVARHGAGALAVQVRGMGQDWGILRDEAVALARVALGRM